MPNCDRGIAVRKVWLIVVIIMLLLALLGDLILWRAYTDSSAFQKEIGQLQATISQQDQRMEELVSEREELRRQLQDMQNLEEEKRRLEEELAAYRDREDFLEQLDRLESLIRALRRLVPSETVVRIFVTAEEMPLQVNRSWSRIWPQKRTVLESQVWLLLELLDNEPDLQPLLLNLHKKTLGSTYDPQMDQLYIVDHTPLGMVEQLAFVYAYTQALQDQLLDLGEQLEAVAEDSDRSRALRALAEGDAALAVQQYYTDELGGGDTLNLFTRIFLSDPSLFEDAPTVVQASLRFPYEQGLVFVMEHYTRTGWSAVNKVWGDPPQSTEQILHPERYPEDTPELIALPALTTTLGAGWQLQGEDTLGEFILRLHLAVRLGEDQVDEAASGWGGDHYALYINEESGEICLALKLSWDDRDEADEFIEAYLDYADQRYGPIPEEKQEEGDVEDGIWWEGRPGTQAGRHPGLYLEQDDEEVILILASREELAERVARRLR